MTNPDALFGRLGNRLFQLAYIYAQAKHGHIPDIYVQDYRHFEPYIEDLKQWWGEDIGFLPYVSIHVRRGDYVNNSFYVDLTETDYYEQAMALFPHKNFLVFSDDPVFCKTLPLFQAKNVQVMEGGTELDDFNMQSSCESNIIANSSYSYWCAILNPNPGKTVVAPSVTNWYRDGVERTICPPEWKRI